MSVAAAVPILIGIATDFGLPLLRKALGDRIGSRNTELAEDVIKAVAKRAGVSPEELPEVPEKDLLAAAHLAELNDMPDLLSKHFESWHEILKRDQESRDTIARIWRPLNGLAFGLACYTVILTVCIAVLLKIPLKQDLMPLVGLVVPVITAWAGVVGVYVFQRSREKLAGAQ